MEEFKPEQLQRDIAVFVGELCRQEQKHGLQVKATAAVVAGVQRETRTCTEDNAVMRHAV